MQGSRQSLATLVSQCNSARRCGLISLVDLKSDWKWKPSVEASLSFLPDLYPGGSQWLKNRLIDINEERARCLLAVTPTKLLGLAIQTPKGPGVVKLSTFYVDPSVRAKGVGSTLLRALTESWKSVGVRKAYVTVASSKVAELEPLLHRFEFKFADVHSGRYGMSRDEFVYEWIRHRR